MNIPVNDPLLATGFFNSLREKTKMATNTLNAFLEPSDEANDMRETFPVPETPDDLNEPFIKRLVKQQEELNRFRDVCNPGISYGFCQYW